MKSRAVRPALNSIYTRVSRSKSISVAADRIEQRLPAFDIDLFSHPAARLHYGYVHAVAQFPDRSDVFSLVL